MKNQKMSDAKNEKERLKLVSLIRDCLLKQTEHNLTVASHRKSKFISFEDYKKRLISGKYTKNILLITSKHIISFYNYILKNSKNIISKDMFELEYNKTLNSLDDISKKYNIPRENITYLRDFYGIKRKGATFIRRLTNEQPLSGKAKEIIIGSMLGDGHMSPWGYFSEKHSEKQIKYLEWKASFLPPIINGNSFRADSYIDKRWNTKIYSVSVRTTTHSDLIKFRKIFYKNNKLNKPIKIIPSNMEDLLSERVLAVWFMDDGSTGWPFRNGVRTSKNASMQCKISSESFTYQENLLLSNILLKKFGLVANIRFRNKNKRPYLRFSCESSKKLIKMLKKYATPDLLYKFDENAYLLHIKKIRNKDLLLQDFRTRHNI